MAFSLWFIIVFYLLTLIDVLFCQVTDLLISHRKHNHEGHDAADFSSFEQR